jgi:hypothetical protein
MYDDQSLPIRLVWQRVLPRIGAIDEFDRLDVCLECAMRHIRPCRCECRGRYTPYIVRNSAKLPISSSRIAAPSSG